MKKSDERLMRLIPEERLAVAMDMTNASTMISAESIKEKNPGISEKELVEKLRARLSNRRR